jgi:hypothetical protein
MDAPLVIYADFECFLVPVAEQPDLKRNGDNFRFTHQHVPNSFAAICARKCGCEGTTTVFDSAEITTDGNITEAFLSYCLARGEESQALHDVPVPIKMSKEEWKRYSKTITCHICNLELHADITNSNKARDHCHR